MKNPLLFLFSLFIIALAGCSNDPSVDSHPKEQMVPDQTKSNVNVPNVIAIDESGNKSAGGKVQNDKNAAAKMDELNFVQFDLEIEYPNEQDFELEYEQKGQAGDYQATLIDRMHEKTLKGVEAFQALYNQVKDLNFTANTRKEDAVNAILQRFRLSDDYERFELEIMFKDGTTLEVEDE